MRNQPISIFFHVDFGTYQKSPINLPIFFSELDSVKNAKEQPRWFRVVQLDKSKTPIAKEEEKDRSPVLVYTQ